LNAGPRPWFRRRREAFASDPGVADGDARSTDVNIGTPGAARRRFEPAASAEASRNASDVGLFGTEELKIG